MSVLQKKQRLGAAALLLAGSAFLSRIMGLVRDKIISWQFGAGAESDLYFAAFVVPDMINYLLAGGFMSITLLPILAKGFNDDKIAAWDFFSCVFLWMFLAACFLTGAGELWAPALAKIIAPGFTQEQCIRLAFFMRIILPAQIFFLSGSCFTALLLLRKQFAVPALTPLIYNGMIIISGLFLPLLFKNDSDFGMTGYCIGVSLGAFLGAFMLPFFTAIKQEVRLKLVWRHPWFIKFLFLALPLMLGQTVVMLDEQFLRIFGSLLGEGSVSILNYGRRITQVPIALMGQAIAVASYPFLVQLLAKNDLSNFNKTLNTALSAGIGLIIPAASFMTASAYNILGIIFQGGKFGNAETIACVPVTSILLAAAPFWILYMVLARAFYAKNDTLTPAITGTIMTIICIPAYYFLSRPLGINSIAVISGLSIAVYSIWLLLIWIKRYGSNAFAGLPELIGKCLIFSVLSAISSWLVNTSVFFDFLPLNTFAGMLFRFILSGFCFGAVFLILAQLFDPSLPVNLLRGLLRKKG